MDRRYFIKSMAGAGALIANSQLPALAEDKPADQGGKDSSSPKTADSFDPRMLLIMLGASILGLAVCVGKKKENR